MTIWMTSIHERSYLLTVTYLHENSMHPADKSTSVCIQQVSSNTNNSFNIWLRHLNTEFLQQYIFFLPHSPIYLLQSDNKTPYWEYPVDGQCDALLSPVSKPRVAGLKNRHFVAGYLIFKKKKEVHRSLIAEIYNPSN